MFVYSRHKQYTIQCPKKKLFSDFDKIKTFIFSFMLSSIILLIFLYYMNRKFEARKTNSNAWLGDNQ